MKFLRPKPVLVVLSSWFFLILVAAWGAYGSVQHLNISGYWGIHCFATTLLGPLSDWSKASCADHVFSVLATIGLVGLTVLYLYHPTRLTMSLFMLMMFFWLIVGLGAAYAWV